MFQGDYRTGTKASTFEFDRAMEFAKIFGLEIPPPGV